MPRSPRAVKERYPKIMRSAESLLGLIWLWAVYSFAFNGSYDFVRWKFSDQVNPTPLLMALIPTALVIAGLKLVLRMQLAAGKSLAQLQAMSPDEFEDWVAARFRGLGYSTRVAGAQGDHGVDLVAEKSGVLAVVQCKNYKSWSVGEPVLRDLYGAMHDFGASRAFLVTTGRVTRSAAKWAEGKPIEIWDGECVAKLSKQLAAERKKGVSMQMTRTVAGGETVCAPLEPAGRVANSLVAPVPKRAAVDPDAVTCPRCGSALVEKRNRGTGAPFLACPRYPACRYTRPGSA